MAALLVARLLAPARRSERAAGRAPLVRTRRLLAIAGVTSTIVLLAAVVLSGRDGGRTPDVHHGAPLAVTQWMVWTGTGVLAATVVVALLVVRRVERSTAKI